MLNYLHWNFNCLCNFARLCRVIAIHVLQIDEAYLASREREIPTMVHLLYTVNFGLPAVSISLGNVGESTSFLISLSSSLPHSVVAPLAKELAKMQRKDIYQGYTAAVGEALEQWDFASCAENLNILRLI